MKTLKESILGSMGMGDAVVEVELAAKKAKQTYDILIDECKGKSMFYGKNDEWGDDKYIFGIIEGLKNSEAIHKVKQSSIAIKNNFKDDLAVSVDYSDGGANYLKVDIYDNTNNNHKKLIRIYVKFNFNLNVSGDNKVNIFADVFVYKNNNRLIDKYFKEQMKEYLKR